MSAVSTKWFSKDDAALIALATILCGLAAWMIWLNDPLRYLEEAPVVGELNTEGQIRRRRAGLLFWEQLDNNSPLYLKDTLVSPPQTSAVIHLKNGTSITLEPNSMLQLKEILKHNFEATVFYGNAREKGVGAQRVALAKTEKRQSMAAIQRVAMKPLVITLVNELPDLFPLLEKERNFFTRVNETFQAIPVREPIKRILYRDRPVALDSIEFFTLQLRIPGGGTKLNTKKMRWVNLSWTRIPLKDTRYTVEFSPRKDFSSAVTYNTARTELPMQLTTVGKYYVRVRALHKNKRINSSPIELEIAP